MLVQLYIQNVAVIEKVTVELENGLNAFTGETGAGKSILINSISAVTGGRISRDIVRTGADKAVISAVFSGIGEEQRSRINELGYELEEDGELLIMRTIAADGKSSCRINGLPATLSVLREATRGLADIYGQHDTAELMASEKHIGFIDGFAGTEDKLREYRAIYAEKRRLEREIERISADERDREQLISVLQYQADEIDAAGLEPGEEEELDKKRRLIRNSERLAELFGTIEDDMNGADDGEEDGALALLDDFRGALSQLTDFYPELSDAAQRANDIYYELDEMFNDIRSYGGDIEYDPAMLNSI